MGHPIGPTGVGQIAEIVCVSYGERPVIGSNPKLGLEWPTWLG